MTAWWHASVPSSACQCSCGTEALDAFALSADLENEGDVRRGSMQSLSFLLHCVSQVVRRRVFGDKMSSAVYATRSREH